MISLGIDTSTNAVSLGIVEDGRTICEDYCRYEKPSGDRLHPILCNLLKEAKLSLKDIDLFACCIGPGSFTGLRIGIAAMKGFAASLGKPVFGISTLDALASRFIGVFKSIVPIIDARRDMVYASMYEDSKQVLPPMKIGIDEFLENIKGDALFLGNGVDIYKDLIIGKLKERAIFLTPNIASPRGSDVAYSAILSHKEGRNTTLEPIYLNSPSVRKKIFGVS